MKPEHFGFQRGGMELSDVLVHVGVNGENTIRSIGATLILQPRVPARFVSTRGRSVATSYGSMNVTKKLTLAALVSVAALVLMGATADQAPKILEVGKTYVVAGGGMNLRCQVTEDLGNGWFRVKRNNGGLSSTDEVRINVATAFFVQEQK